MLTLDIILIKINKRPINVRQSQRIKNYKNICATRCFINMVSYYKYPSRHLVKQRVQLSIVMMH